MRKSNQPKWILAALGAVIVIAVITWLMRSKDGTRFSGGTKQTAKVQPSVSEARERTPLVANTSGSSRSPAFPSTIRLEARLIGGANARATISLGTIAPEDWVEINAHAKNLGSASKQPKKASDFARFSAAQPITISADENSNGIINLPAVPPAAVYRIDAVRVSDNAWYRGRLVANNGVLPDKSSYDFGDIEPVLPTGMRIAFTNAPKGHEDFELSLERNVAPETAEHASGLLDYVEKVRPDILEALRGGTRLTVSTTLMTTLAPLPPDPSIRLHFRTLTGVEGAPIKVNLSEQQIVDTTIDLSKVFQDIPAGAVSLRGRLLLGGSDHPIGGATVERENAPISGLQTTDAEGLFAFEGIPPGVECRFRVMIPRAESGRPLCPAQAAFVYTAPADAGDAEQYVDWRVPAYQWLVLKVTKEQSEALSKLAKRSPIGQPIFILQNYNRGMWIDDAADEFMPGAGEMAVSVTETGRYRVAVAANPVYTIISADAQIGQDATQTFVTLPEFSSEMKARTLQITTTNGTLVKEGRVWINGSHRSVPPIEMLIPPDGKIELPALNVDRLNIVVQRPGSERIPLSLPVMDEGPLELRLDGL